jgi:hypothetical protein
MDRAEPANGVGIRLTAALCYLDAVIVEPIAACGQA